MNFSEVNLKYLVLLIVTFMLLLGSGLDVIAQEQNNNEGQTQEAQTEQAAEQSTEQTTEQTTEQSNQANQAQDTNTPSDGSVNDSEIKPPTSLIEQFKSDIERSISGDLLNPMLAGTEDFLTITQPDAHQTDKGVAILLPEWSQAATDPKAINFLRQHLPDDGWTTITIQPLAKPENYPSTNEKLALAQEENQKALSEYQTKLAAIMTAVMAKAADYPGIFLVVAQGSNGAMLLDLYHQDKLEKPNAFITLSTYLLTEQDNNALAKKMAELDLPVLDVVLRKDVLWVEHFAKKRQKTARKALKTYYRQRELHNFRAGYYPTERLAKEMKGWLTTIGW